MTPPAGRREANKLATRTALVAAATRLFAERGYEGTTVRDIARAANVTERTFYRYFDGKEGLIAGEYLSLLAVLRDAIVSRPAEEPPLTAVHRAMISIVRQAGTDAAPAPLWLFRGRPFAGVRRSAPRPLLRLEAAVAEAVLARLGGSGEEFRAQVIARVAVAAFRSAIIRHRELRKDGDADPRGMERLLGEAFGILAGEEHAPRPR